MVKKYSLIKKAKKGFLKNFKGANLQEFSTKKKKKKTKKTKMTSIQKKAVKRKAKKMGVRVTLK